MNATATTDPKAIERAARSARILELGTSRSTVWDTIQRARAAARAAGVVTA